MKSHTLFVALYLTAPGLTGCGHNERDPQGDRIVAVVNDHEITLAQLRQAMQANAQPATPESAKRAIDSLIEEELLVQEAKKIRLDRDPAVVQVMERTSRRALAEAYAEKVLYSKEQISAREQAAFYEKNPALFEKRRIYHLTVFTVSPASLSSKVWDQLRKARSAEELRELLYARQVVFETQRLVRPAEQLPLDKVNDFAAAKTGDLLTAARDSDGKVMLMSVAAIENSPITLENARPVIAQYLASQRNDRALSAHLREAKSSAKISYAQGFAGVAPADEAAYGSEAGHADSELVGQSPQPEHGTVADFGLAALN